MTQAFNLSQLANKVNTSGQLDVATGASGTLPIANGGTGLTTVGTDGQILQSNGSALVYATPSPGGFSNMQVFTSNGTFTVPAGVTKVKVTVVGGGGNSGSATYGSPSAPSSSGGGGGGGAAIEIISGLIPGGTVSVTVGGAGGTSSFGAYCSATGGGASPNTGGGVQGAGGVGGTGSGGDINFTGSRGQSPTANLLNTVSAGGSSILGGQQPRDISVSAGQNGLNYGGGASGVHRLAPVGTQPGATGGSGIVIVEY